MLDGLLNLSFWGYVLATLLLTHITIASITIFLHRHQAHRALDLHPLISHFFRLWLWLTTGMETRAWTAIHRKHHAKCETAEDPHSPQILGIKTVFWQGSELYRKEAKNPETLARYGHGTPDDWLERHLYERHSLAGVVVMLILNLLLFGLAGIAIWGMQMLWSPVLAAGVINGIGHWWGYRNYECPDAATNIVPWGILIGGEELHNNHHTFASSAKLSSKWWEFDIGWMYICVLEMLGLARVKKIAPIPQVLPDKARVDMETLSALVTNRFRVMASFSQQVVRRVCKEELRKTEPHHHGLLRRARRLLVREESLMNDEARQKLASVLNHSHTLNTVYQFKQRLQDIWKRSTETQENLLQALQEWCRQAEASGIKALQDFAFSLRGYSMQVA